MLVLLRFSATFKASSFPKFLVLLSSEFHTTIPLYEKLFLPNSVFLNFTSSNTPLPHKERTAIKDLRNNHDINVKKADKGTTTVIMSRHDKIKEGQVQLDDLDNCRPLEKPMVEETAKKAKQIISELYQRNHIDSMTKKWLLQTPNPPRIPVFYTLTKIHKPKPVGRPIISDCEGPTERISLFVDSLLQPVAKVQKSYLKDTTEFINTFLVSMDVTSLYTHIPQEEGITATHTKFPRENTPPIPTALLKEMLGLILKENSFQFNGRNYLQTHGTAMGTKMAVAFANIFMCAVETDILSQSNTKPLEWKRYIDDVLSLWDTNREEIDKFIEHANRHHATIKFTAEISDKETTFLDTCAYKGKRFKKENILDVRSHFKPTDTFQYTHYSSCHPPGVSKGFIKLSKMKL
ncbi:uncharacterized protein [Montipora capricornis]|uniref:uncharacterized protein n=1 Tax=Montipora capricornis TaxID=246305 RepID=UPI0035F17336